MIEETEASSLKKNVSVEMNQDSFFSDDSFQDLEDIESPTIQNMIRDQEGKQKGSQQDNSLKCDDKKTIPSDSVKSNIEIIQERNYFRQQYTKLMSKYETLGQQLDCQSEKRLKFEKQLEKILNLNKGLSKQIGKLRVILGQETTQKQNGLKKIKELQNKEEELQRDKHILNEKICSLSKKIMSLKVGNHLKEGVPPNQQFLFKKLDYFKSVTIKIEEIYQQIQPQNRKNSKKEQQPNIEDKLSVLNYFQAVFNKLQGRINAQRQYIAKLQGEMSYYQKKEQNGNSFTKWFDPVVKFCQIENNKGNSEKRGKEGCQMKKKNEKD